MKRRSRSTSVGGRAHSKRQYRPQAAPATPLAQRGAVRPPVSEHPPGTIEWHEGHPYCLLCDQWSGIEHRASELHQTRVAQHYRHLSGDAKPGEVAAGGVPGPSASHPPEPSPGRAEAGGAGQPGGGIRNVQPLVVCVSRQVCTHKGWNSEFQKPPKLLLLPYDN